MAQQTINVGAAPNDGTGTPLRTAFQYTNSNFSELYTATGPSGNNIVVPGNATITGDLTVDTSTLKVDSANNRVGIGTASPAETLHVSGGNIRMSINQFLYLYYGSATNYASLGADNSGNVQVFTGLTSPANRFQIANDGVCTWSNVGGVANTAMTLNATGLGVGDAPAANSRLTIGSTNATGFQYALRTTGITTGRSQIYLANTSGDLIAGIEGSTAGQTISGSAAYSSYVGTATSNPFYITTNGSVKATVDSSGNVGIGVTPSYKLQSVGIAAATSSTVNGSGGNLIGALLNSDDANSGVNPGVDLRRWTGTALNHGLTYIATNATGDTLFYNGTAASNTRATSIKMTLDASGRLGVGVVPASNTRTHFKGSSTSTDYINYCVNSSDKLAFGIRNDGLMITGSSADSATLPNAPYNLTSGSAANVFVDSQGIFYRSTSSLKYKTDIADSIRGLADVLKLRPVTYKAKNSGDIVFGGLIAEEVDAAGLTEFVQYAPDNTPDAIHYGNMVSLMVAAIKELAARVQTLETR